MNKSLEDYLERMGYMPCYKFPEYIDEDKEFKYYRFRVPRHYIRDHIAEGNIWPDYIETREKGTRDDSVVLGVGFFIVYTGVEYLDSDADFVYYKVRVPKVFLDSYISGSPYTYGELYETKDFRWKSRGEKAEIDSEEIECAKPPKAGDSMPNRQDLKTVRKTIETKILLYEVVFYCDKCQITHEPEVGSDLFDLLHNRSCAECGSTTLHLKGCKSILEEKRDE